MIYEMWVGHSVAGSEVKGLCCGAVETSGCVHAGSRRLSDT